MKSAHFSAIVLLAAVLAACDYEPCDPNAPACTTSDRGNSRDYNPSVEGFEAAVYVDTESGAPYGTFRDDPFCVIADTAAAEEFLLDVEVAEVVSYGSTRNTVGQEVESSLDPDLDYADQVAVAVICGMLPGHTYRVHAIASTRYDGYITFNSDVTVPYR